MKKVIIFINNLGAGGAQRQASNVAVLLKKQGYEVEMLVYQDNPFFKPFLEENGVPVALVKSSKAVERLRSIGRHINRSGCDTVIAFLETPCFVACFAKMWRKKWRLITTERSAKLSTFTLKRNRFFNKFERFADKKIGNSNNAMELWRKYYPQYSNKYGVIYNYISVPNEYTSAKHNYLSDGKLHITIAASYQELKNPILVIEALRGMTEEQKARIVIDWYGAIEVTAGFTGTYDKAVALVKEYGLSDVIHLNGETNEIYSKMMQNDVVALFSTVEGLPNAICEAMVIGRPIIMSRVSDYDVLVTDNGVLCDPHSVESVREALVAMLSKSKEELDEMGRRSKQKATELFSAEAITKQWMEVIENK